MQGAGVYVSSAVRAGNAAKTGESTQRERALREREHSPPIEERALTTYHFHLSLSLITFTSALARPKGL